MIFFFYIVHKDIYNNVFLGLKYSQSVYNLYGYKEGEETEQQKELDSWKLIPGATFLGGTLCMNNSVINKKIDSLNWRFRFEAKIDVNTGKFILDFNDRLKSVIYITP